MSNVVAVIIPARLHSTRLPRKMLLHETGKPLILHTAENATQAKLPTRVVVATDSPEIKTALMSSAIPVILTSPDHTSGTDRIAEAALTISADIIINVQGDEPEIEPQIIDRLAQTMIDNPTCPMATVACPLQPQYIHNPDCVKVVHDNNNYALYFSRAPIPFKRDSDSPNLVRPLLHLGIYAYRADFLQTFSHLTPGTLEQTEKLEQLRVLEHGYKIKVLHTPHETIGIDTQTDYDRFVTRIQGEQQ